MTAARIASSGESFTEPLHYLPQPVLVSLYGLALQLNWQVGELEHGREGGGRPHPVGHHLQQSTVELIQVAERLERRPGDVGWDADRFDPLQCLLLHGTI